VNNTTLEYEVHDVSATKNRYGVAYKDREGHCSGIEWTNYLYSISKSDNSGIPLVGASVTATAGHQWSIGRIVVFTISPTTVIISLLVGFWFLYRRCRTPGAISIKVPDKHVPLLNFSS
jgi:hypothetical protein